MLTSKLGQLKEWNITLSMGGGRGKEEGDNIVGVQ